tara:strand:+ start:278 stop:1180 length:903 start_codon:yes stop_codon:yes gene_type:complete
MPTILNTKEETNKTIPIDTSGESMDIEIENKNDDLEETVAEVSTNEETVTSEEGEEYSQSVKKRIDKLTFKIREAERQKEEALVYAKSVKEERDTLKGKMTKVDEGYINEYSARVKSELNKAESVLQSAINAGDVKAQVEAQKAIARLAIEEERANSSIKQREQIKENLKNDPTPPTPPTPKQAQPDPKAEAWAEKNEWFGKDEAMTFTALSFHKKLISEEGFDGKTDEYYSELDKRIKKEFPHKFEDKNKDSRRVQTVASANRSTKNGRKVVRLTPSQIAIAKRLGVPLEEYAKHVKEA